ncbi:MAG: ATP-binding protein [Gammaproteobacteria bacterium]|nr:ATP-binding protein [Gammaproteobacteria bacterium]
MYPRFVKKRIERALSDTRVVLLSGPRQSGKTTLALDISTGTRQYLTMDNDITRRLAIEDPIGLIRGLNRVTIDEIQKAPALLSAIKQSVDFDPVPGKFLLTGSTNFMATPDLPDSLAGRIEIIPILPISQAEIIGKPSTFIDDAFAGQVPQAKHVMFGDELIETVLSGGYPEPLGRKEWVRKQDWYSNYLDSLIERDLRDLGRLDQVSIMPKLISVLAEYSGQLVNYSNVGKAIGLNHVSAKKYIQVLERLYLVKLLHPWFKNRLKRQIKSPKLQFLDSGLLATIRKASLHNIQKDKSSFGPILETFVYSEIMKISTWSEQRCSFYHYRDKDRNEVDFVIENQNGEIVGIEVKSSATVSPKDFSGLKKLREACGDKFMQGLILFDHDQGTPIPYKESFYAVPISVLWNTSPVS